jgi:molybdenum cofactor cytidylyltransferase
VIAGLILAAGRSARLGRPKQLLDLGGRPLLQHVIDTAGAAGLSEIVVVVGHRASEVSSALTLPGGARILVNPDHESGQASSLRLGLEALGLDVEGAEILLGDQPQVTAEAVAAVADAYRASPSAPIVRARYAAGWGYPVLLARTVWEEARSLSGDLGARALMFAHADVVVEAKVEGARPYDVDTWEDYRRLLRELGTPPSPSGGDPGTG